MHPRRSYVWEFLALLILGAVLLRAAINWLLPLVPYMVGLVALTALGAMAFGAYKRRQFW
jgi:CHASE2 domain-containing sensor protein